MFRFEFSAVIVPLLFLVGCNLTACNGEVAEAKKGVGAEAVAKRAQPLKKAKPGRVGSLEPERKEKLLSRATPEIGTKSDKDDGYYQELLTDEEYYVLREDGTERAFSGVYYDSKVPGTYHCRACNAPLYESATKFKSGTGWPSFYEAIDGRVDTELDNSLGMQRTELVCAHCGSHLGHVFDDGPEPTGKRHCINSLSLVLEEQE